VQGNERCVEQLETHFQKELAAKKAAPWVTTETGMLAGMVCSASGNNETTGNITFVTVHEAGHMVPAYNQPEAGLELMTRWLYDIPLALNTSEAATHVPFRRV